MSSSWHFYKRYLSTIEKIQGNKMQLYIGAQSQLPKTPPTKKHNPDKMASYGIEWIPGLEGRYGYNRKTEKVFYMYANYDVTSKGSFWTYVVQDSVKKHVQVWEITINGSKMYLTKESILKLLDNGLPQSSKQNKSYNSVVLGDYAVSYVDKQNNLIVVERNLEYEAAVKLASDSAVKNFRQYYVVQVLQEVGFSVSPTFKSVEMQKTPFDIMREVIKDHQNTV
jgi:hypothetical protein